VKALRQDSSRYRGSRFRLGHLPPQQKTVSSSMKLKTLCSTGCSVGLVSVALLFSSCATILKGSTEKIPIRSQPSGANVRVDNISIGATPIVAEVSRKTSHRVEISLAGYRTFEVVLEQYENNAAAGNFVAGGIIGLVVDSSSGANNSFKPDHVDAVLQKR